MLKAHKKFKVLAQILQKRRREKVMTNIGIFLYQLLTDCSKVEENLDEHWVNCGLDSEENCEQCKRAITSISVIAQTNLLKQKFKDNNKRKGNEMFSQSALL